MSDAAAGTSSAGAPLAVGPRGIRLLDFHRVTETTRFADARVGFVLLAVRHEGRVLMVHVRERACWELPGGGIEEGETPRAAAVRELWEETGLTAGPEALRFVGFARTGLGEPQHVLYGALFTCAVEATVPFAPNEEISDVHWRTGDEPLPYGQVQTVDEYLLALCAG